MEGEESGTKDNRKGGEQEVRKSVTWTEDRLQ